MPLSSLTPPPLLLYSSCPLLPHPRRANPLIKACHIFLNILSISPFTPGSPPGSRSGSPSPNDTLTLRALVTTKEAGIIIGKGGKNVADIRDQSGVKAGVSKVVPGVHERVLSVSGSVEAVSKVRVSLHPLFLSFLS